MFTLNSYPVSNKIECTSLHKIKPSPKKSLIHSITISQHLHKVPFKLNIILGRVNDFYFLRFSYSPILVTAALLHLRLFGTYITLCVDKNYVTLISCCETCRTPQSHGLLSCLYCVWSIWHCSVVKKCHSISLCLANITRIWSISYPWSGNTRHKSRPLILSQLFVW